LGILNILYIINLLPYQYINVPANYSNFLYQRHLSFIQIKFTKFVQLYETHCDAHIFHCFSSFV